MIRYISLVVLSFVLLGSCAKKLTEVEKVEKVKRVKTSELMETMDSLSRFSPIFFYSKISTRYKDTTRSISFKTSLRMAKDSALNAIITYAAIPVVNALITNDSLTVVNKRDKCVVRADLNYFRENFGVYFDFKNIEELILGIPLGYDTIQKYFQIHEPYRYVISSHRKRTIRVLDRKEKDEDGIMIKYFLSSNAKQLDGIEIYSPNDTTSVYVQYLTRQEVSGFSMPEKVRINVITPKNNLLLELTYDKVELNEPQPLYFIIPEGYEDCE